MEVSGQLQAMAALPARKRSQCPLNIGICGLRIQPECFEDETKNNSAPSVFWIVQRVAWLLYWLNIVICECKPEVTAVEFVQLLVLQQYC